MHSDKKPRTTRIFVEGEDVHKMRKSANNKDARNYLT